MLSNNDLQQMSQINIKDTGAHVLADISEVSVDRTLSADKRFEQYIEQIRNPYAFICEGARVKVSFSDTDKTLDNVLVRYFSNLKNQ